MGEITEDFLNIVNKTQLQGFLIPIISANILCFIMYTYNKRYDFIQTFTSVKQMSLILFNWSIVYIIVIINRYLSLQFMLDYQYNTWVSHILSVIILDIILFTSHRYIMHNNYFKYFNGIHKVHHSAIYDYNDKDLNKNRLIRLNSMHLFYIHPLDSFLEFKLPWLILSFIPMDQYTLQFLLASSIINNTIAHHGKGFILMESEHNNHHTRTNKRHINQGTGLFCDVIFKTSNKSFDEIYLSWMSQLFGVKMFRQFIQYDINTYNQLQYVGLCIFVYVLISKLFWKLTSINIIMRQVWKAFQSLLDTLLQQTGNKDFLEFMNWGYCYSNINEQKDPFEFRTNLYKHVLDQNQNYNNKLVLDVGCGRGGGIKLLSKLYSKIRFMGVDLTDSNIIHAKRNNDISIDFRVDDAMELNTIEDKTIDVVMNVETSHCYPNIERFIDSVYRVLKVDGLFQITDFRSKQDFNIFQELIKNKFEILRDEDITENVMKSSRLMTDYYTKTINSVTLVKIFPFMKESLIDFACAENSKPQNKLKERFWEYRTLTLKKKVM